MTDLAGLSEDLLSRGGNLEFKSLTAQKLMAGLSFNSIDTLLEVNAAAEARSRGGGNPSNAVVGNGGPVSNVIMNQSTETVDFGVI